MSRAVFICSALILVMTASIAQAGRPLNYEKDIKQKVKTSKSKEEYSDHHFNCRLHQTAYTEKIKISDVEITLTPGKGTEDLDLETVEYTCEPIDTSFLSSLLGTNYDCKGTFNDALKKINFTWGAFGRPEDTCKYFIKKVYKDNYYDMK